MNTIANFSRAFAVLWKDFDYWQVRALRLALTNKSNWPTVRLGDVVSVRNEIVPDKEIQDGRVYLLDRISFDEGKIFFGKRTETRMVQFRARPGDIVVSKINACKRAIGIVQNGTDVSATVHFRVLEPITSIIDTEYLWSALRSSYCVQQFEIQTGGMGKGEISEEKLLGIAVPLPPMAEQRSIVARWRSARSEISAARKRAERTAIALEARIFADFGLRPPDKLIMPKAFAVRWTDFLRWGVISNFLSQSGSDLSHGKYPIVRLGDVIADLQNGWSPKCLDRSASSEEWGVLKLGAVSFGLYNDSANKALPSNFHEKPEFEVKAGDVLISRGNVLSLVGATVHVKATRERLMIPDLIFRVIWKKKSLINGAFLAEVLGMSILREQIESVATGTSPTMKKITKPALLNLNIPFPPLDIQIKIMAYVEVGRAEVVREQQVAENLSDTIDAEIEALILGTKKLKDA